MNTGYKNLDPDWCTEKRHEVLYRVRISSNYHRRRERFFEFLDRGIKAIAIIGSASTFARLAGDAGLFMFSASVTILSTISLVFGLSDRARRHAELAVDFKRLEASITGNGETCLAGQINDWNRQVLELEVREPRTLGALVILCQNERAVAENQPTCFVPLKFYQKLFAHFIDFDVDPHKR